MKHALARAIAAQDVRKQDIEGEPVIFDDDATACREQDGHMRRRRLSANKVSGSIDLD